MSFRLIGIGATTLGLKKAPSTHVVSLAQKSVCEIASRGEGGSASFEESITWNPWIGHCCCSCHRSSEREHASKELAGGNATSWCLGHGNGPVGWSFYRQNLQGEKSTGLSGGESRPQWISGQKGCTEDMQEFQEVWPKRWFLSQGYRVLSYWIMCVFGCLLACFFWDELQRVSLLLFKKQVTTNSSYSIFL